jgi:quinol monooxygenase YgiN
VDDRAQPRPAGPGGSGYDRPALARARVKRPIDPEAAVIVVRFKVQCQPDRTAELAAAMKDVVEPARGLPGVIHFDIGRDLTDDAALIATEVFEDRAAMEREEALPQVAKVVEVMQSGALAGPPEWTIFEVASSESPTM